jgi:hypothetical protein
MQARTNNAEPIVPATQETFLPPIEKPKGLKMKLEYYFARRQFGKAA